jgi:1-acyl-sn-glycerol-3-phosphate acyltransferase
MTVPFLDVVQVPGYLEVSEQLAIHSPPPQNRLPQSPPRSRIVAGKSPLVTIAATRATFAANIAKNVAVAQAAASSGELLARASSAGRKSRRCRRIARLPGERSGYPAPSKASSTFAWWRRFGTERVLHPTAHDVLMATPGLGDYFRQVGVIPASRQGVGAALSAGCDVIIWPGGDVDAMRNWRRRDEAVLGGRTGFVGQAIRSGVPIVPVASVGGHDTVFVLSEGRWIADGVDRISGLKAKLRGSQLPIVLGIPFGLTIETIPTHLPLPAKIRTELLDPIHVDKDVERVNDRAYVNSIYREVESAIQHGMDRLAKQRRFPIFG